MATKSSYRPPAAGRAAGLVFAIAMLLGSMLGVASAAVDTAGTPAQWRTQKLEFTYTGFTAFYTCEGIEGKVRLILLTFGARKDAKVRATGCDRATNAPSRFAWVATEFSALAPVTDAKASDVVKGSWAKVQVVPHKPWDMGQGECELVDQMRPLLQKGFALRNADIRAFCVPKQVGIGDYSVNAEVLQPVAN